MISSTEKARPKKRGAYGVPHGAFRGEIFCYIESSGENHYFLSVPSMEVRVVPLDKFDFGIKNNIMEFIEELPKKVYKVIEAQYKKSRVSTYGHNPDNRRQQSGLEDVLRSRVSESGRDGRTSSRPHVYQRIEELQ